MLKLALIGPPGSGKSTIATAWLGLHPQAEDTAKLSFADHLRWELAEAFALREGLDTKDMFFRLADPSQKTKWRGLLQAWGQARRDVVDIDYWVDVIAKRIDYMETRQFARVAVDDLRYPNEHVMLRAKGFAIVRLAPGPDTVEALTDPQAHHESEVHWPHFSYDHFLTYEHGAAVQARRIEEWLAKHSKNTNAQG